MMNVPKRALVYLKEVFSRTDGLDYPCLRDSLEGPREPHIASSVYHTATQSPKDGRRSSASTSQAQISASDYPLFGTLK